MGDHLAILVNQVGRCLGALHVSTEDDFNVEIFLAQIGEVSQKWKEITLRVYKVLCEGISTKNDYDELGKLVIEYFHSVGLIPELLPDKTMWVDVPFSPETMPKDED